MATTLSYPPSRAPESSRFVALITHPRGQVLFALLALVAIILFGAFFYLYSPYDGLILFQENELGEVYIIYPGGPAEAAGVQVGDRVLAIDGLWVDPNRSEPRYPPGLQAGEVVDYTLQRDNQVLTLPIRIGSYRDNLPLLSSILGIQLLAAGLWIIGVLLVLFVSPGDVRARLLGAGFLLAGVTTAAGGVTGWNSFWGANTLQLILWCLLVPIIMAAHLTFPVVSLPLLRGHIINLNLAASLILAGLVALDGWLLTPHVPDLQTRLPLRQIVLIYFMLCWIGAAGLLLRNRLIASDPDIRRQTGIILWGMALGLGPFFALTLLPYLLFGLEYVSGIYTILFLLLLPLAYTYVIFQRKLLKVDFLINRMVVLFVMALSIQIAFFLIFSLIALALDLPAELPLLGGIVAAIITLPITRVQTLIQRWVNRVLYGSHYDFSSVTSSLSSQLARTLDRDSLIRLLCKGLSRQMGITRTALLLLDGDRLVLQGVPEDQFAVRREDDLCVVLRDAGGPMWADQLWTLDSAPIQSHWARFSWGQLFVPLVFEHHLQGVLILGSRVAGDVYSNQDIEIVATVAHQAALASANVLLVEELRGLAQQLVRTDEAQRKSMARDLHDEVLQDLFFIRQRLPRGEADSELASHVEHLIQKLRGLIRERRSPLLDQGILLALRGLVEERQKLASAAAQIRWSNALEGRLELSEEQATSIYRIAQEALSNALKHAQAHTIEVSLEHTGVGGLRLQVVDDGIGLPVVEAGAAGPSQHYGLVGMRERARMIGARLEVRTLPGGGTKVVLDLQP